MDFDYPLPYSAGQQQQQQQPNLDIYNELNSIPPMSNTGVSIRQVTPPAFQSQDMYYQFQQQQQQQQLQGGGGVGADAGADAVPIVDFDRNADYPEGPGVQPPAYEEFDSQPCDSLNQRVYDASTNQFYKATCLLLEHTPDRAYWLQQQVRNAMYGRVWVGQILRRPDSYYYNNNNNTKSITHWETTGEHVAIKQASLQLLQKAEALNSAEHPRREHAALTHLAMVTTTTTTTTTTNRFKYGGDGGMEDYSNEDNTEETPAQAMLRTGVMMPQDWLHDEHYAYLCMPYCNGGELFDRVGSHGRFTEDEARHWMHQILNSLETLHRAGVAHRDLSLENIMIHNDRAIIIDLGMSLPMPYDPRTGQRRLIASQGAVGKLKYMAPEVYASARTTTTAANHSDIEGFDGCAIDMWAVGVILFIMLTGEMPWQFPDATDLKFQKFTDGWIEPYLKGQGYPLSPNAYCLLQRMLWLNPRDRLSMAQVRAHPWMRSTGGPTSGGMMMNSSRTEPMFLSANKIKENENENNEEEDGGAVIGIKVPSKIQPGRYSKDEDVSPEDLSAMQEKVIKYTRERDDDDETDETEDGVGFISTKEATLLSDDDEYVKAIMAKTSVPLKATPKSE